MNYDDVYSSSSDHLKAGDLQGKRHRLTIKSYEIGEFKRGDGSPERKIIVAFDQTPKTLVLNKTNANRIREMNGNNIDDWIGRDIQIQPEKVDFQGELVDGIRGHLVLPEPELAAAGDGIPF